MSREEREKQLLDVFSKGLRSDEIKATLNTHHVDRLDELIKKIPADKKRKNN